VYVKEQLGQSSIQLTVDTYGHLIPGANRAAVDRLDDALTQPSASQTHPEPEGASAGAQPKSFVLSGDPNVRELEPHCRLYQTHRRTSTGRLMKQTVAGRAGTCVWRRAIQTFRATDG
jgi:hypothetical protein